MSQYNGEEIRLENQFCLFWTFPPKRQHDMLLAALCDNTHVTVTSCRLQNHVSFGVVLTKRWVSKSMCNEIKKVVLMLNTLYRVNNPTTEFFLFSG